MTNLTITAVSVVPRSVGTHSKLNNNAFILDFIKVFGYFIVFADNANVVRVIDFSKPGLPKMVLTDINQSLEEVVKLSAVTLRKNGVKLEKNLTANLPHCYVDPHMIEQVILNLVTNAVKAMENNDSSKMIAIKSHAKNNKICVQISDTGPGIPKGIREKIFEPFFTTDADGSGIGLAISQRIVNDHNGTISVNGNKWGGAEFKIELPVEKRMSPK